MIGTLLLIREEKSKNKVEIGFSFRKETWGKGYGQETLKMVMEKLGDEESVEEIIAWCKQGNIASIRIFEKAAFVAVNQNEYPQSKLFVKKI
ncbi:MAG: GNAT family N-acetyltransferase [Saprospiraceae bacterium]